MTYESNLTTDTDRMLAGLESPRTREAAMRQVSFSESPFSRSRSLVSSQLSTKPRGTLQTKRLDYHAPLR